MPAQILFGDSYLVSGALKELQAQVGPIEVLEANSHRLSGTQIELAQLKTYCNATPFLAQHRLVIVEGLLSLFEPRQPRRKPSTAAGRASAPGSGRPLLSEWDDLPGYIRSEMSPTALLVFLDGKIAADNPLLGKLKPVVQVQKLSPPVKEGLARWIKNRVGEKGAGTTPGAIRLLSQLVGGDLWTLDNELEKLALYAGDRAIEEGDVRFLVSEAREASIFNAVDAILEGRSAVALRSMQRLRDGGAEFTYIVAMIARQLRLVTLARDLIDRGHKERDIAERLGLTLDFVRRKTMEQAKRHPWSDLRWLYGRLMESDVAVKQGRLDEDVALELMVGEASGPGRRS